MWPIRRASPLHPRRLNCWDGWQTVHSATAAAPQISAYTQGDRKSAQDAGIPFVYAAYGFGTVTDYAAKVETFAELKEIFL